MIQNNKESAGGSDEQQEQNPEAQEINSSQAALDSKVHIPSSPLRNATDESFLSNNIEPKLTREGSKIQIPTSPLRRQEASEENEDGEKENKEPSLNLQFRYSQQVTLEKGEEPSNGYQQQPDSQPSSGYQQQPNMQNTNHFQQQPDMQNTNHFQQQPNIQPPFAYEQQPHMYRPYEASSQNANVELPMGLIEWMVILALTMIPVVNIICLLVWAFGHQGNKNRKVFAQAMLTISVITFLLVLALLLVLWGQLSQIYESAVM